MLCVITTVCSQFLQWLQHILLYNLWAYINIYYLPFQIRRC